MEAEVAPIQRSFKISIGEYYLAKLVQESAKDPPFCIFLCLEKGEQTDPIFVAEGNHKKYPGAYTQQWLPCKQKTWATCTWKGAPVMTRTQTNPFMFEDNFESDRMAWKLAPSAQGPGSKVLTSKSVQYINYYLERWGRPELAEDWKEREVEVPRAPRLQARKRNKK